MARFTDGATTVTSSGPRRRFSEPTAADAVTHAVWVRTLPKPFTGAVDEAWLTAALQANALRVPDVLAIAMQYVSGAAAVLDGPLQIAGDAEYGPLVDGKREEGADFNDYLGVTWTYADAVDRPETRQFRCLDCSGFVRMVWGYRHSLPGQPRRDRVPLTLAPDVVAPGDAAAGVRDLPVGAGRRDDRERRRAGAGPVGAGRRRPGVLRR